MDEETEETEETEVTSYEQWQISVRQGQELWNTLGIVHEAVYEESILMDMAKWETVRGEAAIPPRFCEPQGTLRRFYPAACSREFVWWDNFYKFHGEPPENHHQSQYRTGTNSVLKMVIAGAIQTTPLYPTRPDQYSPQMAPVALESWPNLAFNAWRR